MEMSDQISWSHGKHTIRAGFEFEKDQWNIVYQGFERGWLWFGTFNDFLVGQPGQHLALYFLRRRSRARRSTWLSFARHELVRSGRLQSQFQIDAESRRPLGVRRRPQRQVRQPDQRLDQPIANGPKSSHLAPSLRPIVWWDMWFPAITVRPPGVRCRLAF